MICKNCGFEYVDGLKECPNCQAPNEPEETSVLTKEERDTFEGVTIESIPKEQGDGRDYKVYQGDEMDREKQGESSSSYGFKVHTFSGIGLVWQIIILLVIIGLICFVLPAVALFTLIAAICYYLYIWLFA